MSATIRQVLLVQHLVRSESFIDNFLLHTLLDCIGQPRHDPLLHMFGGLSDGVDVIFQRFDVVEEAGPAV
jgi:hypothetical protein